MNIAIEEDKVHVLVFAPGIDPDNFDVSIVGNVLTVRGTREMPETPEGSHVLVKERIDGQFIRTMVLPDDVDPQRIEAQSRDGVLWIQVMRQEATRPRKIPIPDTGGARWQPTCPERATGRGKEGPKTGAESGAAYMQPAWT